MLIKELIGDLLASLVEEPDQLKRMELIDNTEKLNTEHVESGGDSEFEEKYNDLLAKFTKRFTGELVNEKNEESNELDDEVDEVIDENEDEEPDYNNMSFEEAGFKDVLKRKE